MRKTIAILLLFAATPIALLGAYIGHTDWRIEVTRGNVSGTEAVFLSGYAPDLNTTKRTLHPGLSDGAIDQSGIYTAASTVKVASTDADDTSAGAGAQSVLIIGLDANGDEATEAKSLSGQTAVTTTATWTAIHGLIVTAWGASTHNEGTLWVGNGTFTSGIPATKYLSAEPQLNKAHTAYYVVPNNEALTLRQLTIATGTSTKEVEFFVETSTDGTNWISQSPPLPALDTVWQGEVLAVPEIASGTAIRISAKSSGASSDVSALLAGYLEDQ